MAGNGQTPRNLTSEAGLFSFSPSETTMASPNGETSFLEGATEPKKANSDRHQANRAAAEVNPPEAC